MSARNRWLAALDRTRRVTLGRVAQLLGATEIDDAFWEALEAALIQSDVGVATATQVVEDLRQETARQGWTRGEQVQEALRRALLEKLPPPESPRLGTTPHVVLMVGVNGSGKTTAAARLAHWWRKQGRSVLLAAADTFRAAADEQLLRWGQRLGIEVITGEPGSDPGAVVYNAAQAARARKVDVMIADTSGRMHTSHNLMAKLQKVARVASKVVPEAPHEVLLVIDATTGQNALSQARAFTEAVPVTGVVLTKLDTSAKGGVALAVAQQLGLPVRYASVGEGPEDLEPFDPEAYLAGLLGAEAGAPVTT